MGANTSGNHDKGTVRLAGDTVILSRGSGARLSVRAPRISGLRIGPQFDNYHIYSDVFILGPRSHFRGPGGLWRNLTEEPAPRHILGAAWSTSNSPVGSGNATTIGLMGTVVHYFNPRDLLLINVTVPDRHALHPGAVLRAIAEEGQNFVLVTYGVGNGPLAGPNDWLSVAVWGSHARRIARETIFEEANGARYPDPRS